MDNTKGILMMALGHPYYGKMACALAASIRVLDPNIPIVLYTDDSVMNHCREGELKLFTQIKTMSPELYTDNGVKNYFKPKINLYDLTPFETTLYLDVDLCWLKKHPDQIFKELEKVKFTGANEGYWDIKTDTYNCNKNYTFWAEPDDIKKAYAGNKRFLNGKLYQTRTEFLYFKKCEANAKYFELVKELYANPGVKMELIGQRIPDEFAFNMASCLLAHYPHKPQYDPVYWEYVHGKKRLTRGEKVNNFYGYSIGGNVTNDSQKEIYNAVVKQAYRRLSLSFPFTLQKHTDKKKYILERNKI